MAKQSRQYQQAPSNQSKFPILHSIQFIVLGSYNFDWGGTHINYKYCCCWYLHYTVTLCTATIFFYTLCWLGPNMHERKKSIFKSITKFERLTVSFTAQNKIRGQIRQYPCNCILAYFGTRGTRLPMSEFSTESSSPSKPWCQAQKHDSPPCGRGIHIVHNK